MRRNRPDTKNSTASLETVAAQPHSFRALEASLFPRSLHHVFDESIQFMSAGDIIVLDESERLRSQVDADFFAVLACPACGARDLITAAQYFGAVPVIC